MLRDLQRYRQLAIVTTVGICVLVVAGGVVRLTGSGLGCDDWPNCNSERFVDVSSGHTAIEQINRLLSGVIGIPTLLLAVASLRVRPRRAGLRWPALGVLVSVLANGVVGGIAVRGELHPALVQSHFLLAMASIVFGLIAVRRSSPTAVSSASAGEPAEPLQPVTRALAVAVAVATAAVLVTGTVVTGTGPHAGEEDVRRFGFDISNVARTHSITVIVSLLITLALAFKLREDTAGQRLLASNVSAWIFLGLVQGGIGYTQYFNGVPEVLVGAHIAFATMLWVVTIRMADQALAAGATKHLERITSQVSQAA